MTNVLGLLLPACVAAILVFLVTPLVGRIAVKIGALDMPGERKIHESPVPRLGGVGVVFGGASVLIAMNVISGGTRGLPPGMAIALGLGIVPIFAISLLDDVRPVRARTKFLAHTFGATLAVGAGISLGDVVHVFGSPIEIGVLAVPLSILWIVGVTNAFNIIDGLDGLSAGLALISATSMAAVFAMVGQPQMAAVALVLSGALAGFLPFNVHPARLFLGDTGATAIGFCLACFALRGGSTLSSGFAALLPVFILGLPIADTFIAMARRSLLRIEEHRGGVFKPDRNHIHHRLLALGVDHGHAVLILYGVGFVFAAAAFVSMFLKAREAALFLIAILLGGFVGLHRLGYDEFAFIRRGTVLKVYEVPAVKRGMFVVFIDLVLAAAAAYLAVGLKLDEWGGPDVRHAVTDISATFAPITVAVFWQMGLYRGSWRMAGVEDLTRATAAVLIVTGLGGTLGGLWSASEYPVSLFVLYGVISLVLVVGSRSSYVVLLNSQLRASNQGTPVLIYGAGGRGVAVAEELFGNADAGLRPVAFIDDDPSKRGKLISGLPVLGTLRDLRPVLKSGRAQVLLVSSEKISDRQVDTAAVICADANVSLLRFNMKLETLVHSLSALPARKEATTPHEVARRLLTPVTTAVSTAANWHELLASEPCPACQSQNVHRSKARSWYERFRKTHSTSRLFRCHDCGWRGWLLPLEYGVAPVAEPDASDLQELERLFADTNAVVSGGRAVN